MTKAFFFSLQKNPMLTNYKKIYLNNGIKVRFEQDHSFTMISGDLQKCFINTFKLN